MTPPDRKFHDLHARPGRQKQQLGIEAKAGDRHLLKQGKRFRAPKQLKSALGVVNAQPKNHSHYQVKYDSAELAAAGLVLLDIGTIDSSRADNDICVLCLCRRQKFFQLCDRGREIGVGEEYIFSPGLEDAGLDRKALASIGLIPNHSNTFKVHSGNYGSSPILRTVVHDNYLGIPRHTLPECLDFLNGATNADGLIEGGNDDRNFWHSRRRGSHRVRLHGGFRCRHKAAYCIIRNSVTLMINDRLIRACRREPVDRTPVWMMRQAGRYLKEYRDIRQKVSFLELCKNVDLAAEVSLQPLRIVGVDAVIFFSDILIPVEAMGVAVELTDKGPEIAHPIRAVSDVEKLRNPDPADEMPFVGAILRRLRSELREQVPLIGFSGAPWTLASYMIEGGGSKNFAEIKRLAFSEPATLHALLDKLASTIIAYLRFQIESGAQVVQLFDTWAGELTRRDYETFALPVTRRIFAEIGNSVPRILYINGCSSILESMATCGADVLSVDWRIPIGEARARVGDRVALQGNLDPCALLGSASNLTATAERILQEAGTTGHIFNLGHGILPMTPVDNAKALVEFVRSYRHRQ